MRSLSSRRLSSTAVPPSVRKATDRVAAALSVFLDEPVEVLVRSIRSWPVTRITGLLGRPDTPVVGIYLGFEGDASGHVVLLLRRRGAHHLVERLLGTPAKKGQELAQSALGELGNITVSTFLCALSDRRRLQLRPTPPVVIEDQAGAILDEILADVMAAVNEVAAIEVVLRWGSALAGGTLLVLPRPSATGTILTMLGEDA